MKCGTAAPTNNNVPAPSADPTSDYLAAIEQLTGTVYEQDETLAEMLGTPFGFGVVLEVPPYNPDASDFKKKQLVLIIDRANKYCGSHGRLVENVDDKGFVTVKFRAPDAEGNMVEVNEFLGTGVNGSPVQIKPLGRNKRGPQVTIQVGDHSLAVENVLELHLEPGQTVKVSLKSNQIIETADPVGSGDVGRIKSVLSNGKIEVDIPGRNSKVVYVGRFNALQVGDRVALDSTNTVVVDKLPPDFHDQFNLRKEELTVSWDDIGGCEEAKMEIREAIELPYLHPEIYGFYNRKPAKGILLYGPPGCGKTMIGQASAYSLAHIHGSESFASGFLYVKGPELLDRWVGASEEKLRAQFVKGTKHYEAHGYPAILFIDEAEALFRKRGSGVSSDITDNMVTTFLSEMSGIHASHTMVILATNVPGMIDAAVLRDGRCDRQIKVPRPDMETTPDILMLYLKKIPYVKGLSADSVVDRLTSEIFSKAYKLGTVQVASEEKFYDFCLSDIVNGALLQGIVDKAASIALRRDLKKGVKLGVSFEDLKEAVAMSWMSNSAINQELNLTDFAERNKLDIASIKYKPSPVSR